MINSIKEYNVVELALSTIDASAVSKDIIVDMVDYNRNKRIVYSQLFKDARVPQSAKRGIIPKIGSNAITVTYDVTPANTIEASSFTYDGVTIIPKKYGAKLEVTNEALQSQRRVLFIDFIEQAGRSFANCQDDRAQTVALDIQVGTITSFAGGIIGTISSSQVPILEITSVFGATVSSVDYYSGTITLASSVATGTVTYTYSNLVNGTGLYREVDTPQTLALEDVLALRATMIDNSVNPNVVLVNPSDLPNFVQTSTYQGLYSPFVGELSRYNGEIGKLLDLTVVASGKTPSGVAIIADTNRLGYRLIRRPMESKKEIRLEKDSVNYHIYEELDFGLSDTLAIGVVCNAKSGDYPATS